MGINNKNKYLYEKVNFLIYWIYNIGNSQC